MNGIVLAIIVILILILIGLFIFSKEWRDVICGIAILAAFVYSLGALTAAMIESPNISTLQGHSRLMKWVVSIGWITLAAITTVAVAIGIAFFPEIFLARGAIITIFFILSYVLCVTILAFSAYYYIQLNNVVTSSLSSTVLAKLNKTKEYTLHAVIASGLAFSLVTIVLIVFGIYKYHHNHPSPKVIVATTSTVPVTEDEEEDQGSPIISTTPPPIPPKPTTLITTTTSTIPSTTIASPSTSTVPSTTSITTPKVKVD